MAHFAELNSDNIVIKIAVVNDNKIKDSNGNESEALGIASCKAHHASTNTWVQTSYNTQGGVHSLGGTPLRKNFAGVGYTYDSSKDAFIPPKPYNSWILNETTCIWEAPVAKPSDMDVSKMYKWDEDNTQWVEI